LMEFWNTQLPEFIHEVSYEELVMNKDQTIKDILEFCGLPSQMVGSKSSEVNKVVKTLSNIQVRRPMSTIPINNWYNYAEHLSQFTDSEHG
jgi:hypothetical protein